MLKIVQGAAFALLATGSLTVAQAQTAVVVSTAATPADCSAQVIQSLQAAGLQSSGSLIDPAPQGMAVSEALAAMVGSAQVLVSLDLPPATFDELGVATYGVLSCEGLSADGSGDAVLARALELGSAEGFEAVTVLYPETTASALSAAFMAGPDKVAKPSLGEIAAEVASADAKAEDVMMIEVKNGFIAIELATDLAPNHAERMKTLARQGFYDGIVFHRVIEGFMAQTGDPTGTGRGGSDLPDLGAEFSSPDVASFTRGKVGMARSQAPDSANSQFFIMFEDGAFLDGQYTIIGEVLVGMEAVDKIKRGAAGSGAVNNPDKMERVFILSDEL